MFTWKMETSPVQNGFQEHCTSTNIKMMMCQIFHTTYRPTSQQGVGRKSSSIRWFLSKWNSPSSTSIQRLFTGSDLKQGNLIDRKQNIIDQSQGLKVKTNDNPQFLGLYKLLQAGKLLNKKYTRNGAPDKISLSYKIAHHWRKNTSKYQSAH